MAVSWTTSSVDLHVETSGRKQRSSLEDALRSAIQSRRLTAGTTLPSTRALAGDLGIARGTVVAAYDQLFAEGYLVVRRGIGTQVADLGPATAAAAERPDRGIVRLDLRPGTPDVTSFPSSTWMRCMRRALAAAPSSALGYGDVRGRRELRNALVDYLGRTRGVHAAPEQIMITAGITHALSLLSVGLTAAGHTSVAMENPGFAMHRPVVRQAGQRVIALPVDEHGADIDRIADLGTGAPSAVVVTPAHQYPTGVTLHPSRRQALTTWARASGGLIIEDDYDGEFRYERQPIGALQGTAPDQVVYLGTTSKTLAPGLRLGWMVLPHRLIDSLTEVKLRTDLSAPAITQLTLAELITSHGYDRHIRTMRFRYRRRRDQLVRALEAIEPDLVSGVAAGLQAHVRLPAGGPTEEQIIAAAAAEGLALDGMSQHWHGGSPPSAGLLIGFSKASETAYPAAVSLLVRVLRRML
jgi:GntR family transcriptional regulator / MocR family aminotransferase